MSKLDEHLDYMGSSYYPGHEYPESYEPQNVKLRDEAREAIYKDLDAHIVEVESMFELEEYSKDALIACAELRNKLKDYCGGK